ncbi:uncharacterized protein [Panulirus ornatus]|uniref:uncharacterized protein n=1 Tax=Panulirus ornatus TaxID=150431 RepID=UPI003A85D82A
MRAWVLVTLCCFASVTAQDELEARNDTVMSSNERVSTPLVLLEVRKAFGVVSPRDRDHNILKVLLEEHRPLVNVTQWELQMNGESYAFTDDDPMQTELEFGAELTDTDEIIITATNDKNVFLGAVLAVLEIRDMKSRVARVGGKYDSAMSSLRVATGKLEQVQVEDKECKEENSPCYYLLTQLPENVPRCVDIERQQDLGVVRHCDDSITSFREIPERVILNLSGDVLTVEANFTTSPSKVEVVVFDTKEPSNVFSPEGYECRVKGEPRQMSHVCHQQLTGGKDLAGISVLVVSLDREGFVLESRIDVYEGKGISENSSNKGVIVGAVIGVLCAIALIAGIFVYVKGKKETTSRSTQSRASNKYEKTATTEPPPAQEEA